MVKIYDNIKDENGIESPNRVKLFITKTVEDGTISEFLSGNSVVPMTNGTLFIVDDWLIDQLEKELQREALLRQLALLDADTEEVTDEP